MADAMALSTLAEELRDSLGPIASDAFATPEDAALKRHLHLAALDMGRVRSRTLVGSLTLMADEESYAAPADLIRPKFAKDPSSKPWDRRYRGPLPRLHLVEEGASNKIMVDPTPDAAMVADYSKGLTYFYYGGHVIGDSDATTTVRPEDKGLLLLRAQAEAMKELSMRNVTKPVALRDGMTSAPRNGTPSALYEILMRQWREMAQ